jgi:hypothetical protein
MKMSRGSFKDKHQKASFTFSERWIPDESQQHFTMTGIKVKSINNCVTNTPLHQAAICTDQCPLITLS